MVCSYVTKSQLKTTKQFQKVSEKISNCCRIAYVKLSKLSLNISFAAIVELSPRYEIKYTLLALWHMACLMANMIQNMVFIYIL